MLKQKTELPVNDSVTQRFWSKVDRTGGCWNWTAAKTKTGYGTMTLRFGDRDYKRVYVHRIAFVLGGGNLQQGMTIDHLCRNRLCVNPAHLEQVTVGENSRRGTAWIPKADNERCPRGHEPRWAYQDSKAGNPARYCMTCNNERSGAAHRRRRRDN